VNHFVSKFAQRMGKDISFISRNAMDALTNAPWKGNVRELGNFMERCVILTQGNELNVLHLEVKDSAARKVVRVASSFREAERRVIIDALSDASGRIAGKGGAAERLGLRRTTPLNKMRRPFPNARRLGHPFQWKNTLPWHAAKVRILRFKNLPPFRHYPGLQDHV
jgi:formate hydrogenlyase transcriptional activator